MFTELLHNSMFFPNLHDKKRMHLQNWGNNILWNIECV